MKIDKNMKVSCVGGGIIGYSFALTFALKVDNVTVYDISDEALELSKERVHNSIKLLIKNSVITEEAARKIENKIIYTKSMEEAVTDANFIQESGPENYDIKHKIMEEIEKYCPCDAIIASSTSGLLVTEIAKYAKNKGRFVGGHPYNPPHLIPLIEITKGQETTADTVKLAKEFYSFVNKEPVVLEKEALGFICNRLQIALYREVCYLVMNGVCSIEDADKAVTFGPGLRWGIMGPSLIFELGGGKSGIDGLMKHIGPSIKLWLNDMADFKEFPEKWGEIAKEGVVEELKNRSSEIGNTYESLMEYRDNMLIELLKLHKKL